MRIVNVITIKHNVVDEIESFAIYEEQLSEDVVEVAEAYFTKKALLLGTEESDMESAIEDGYFVGANFSICLTWSTTD